ncbi:hypothetical protein OCF65_25675 [Bacillus toyonensis]|uniref:hypothetical protein n=1 Tax=Bacillus toyonensis TaxID=155322 RepID=UPI0021D0AAC4|nr:hypothetical protein [Bacillus toyonensis]MCU5583789.1 hypothetical protein [Bacillus toyonensis]
MIQQTQHYFYHLKTQWFILFMTFASFLLPLPTSFLPGGLQKNPIEDEYMWIQIVDSNSGWHSHCTFIRNSSIPNVYILDFKIDPWYGKIQQIDYLYFSYYIWIEPQF